MSFHQFCKSLFYNEAEYTSPIKRAGHAPPLRKETPMAINREEYLTILEDSANRVPRWARSTNPIVRRHMGFNWRTVAPELRPMLYGFLFWTLIFVIGTFVPLVQSVMMMVLLASWIIMPFAWLVYGHILLQVAIRAADIMQEEQRNNTLQLLMATPMSVQQIFLGKIAASLWRRMDDLYLVGYVVAWLAAPMLFAIYEPLWNVEEYVGVSQGFIVLALAVSLLRLLLEPILIGSLAILIGVLTTGRSIAITSTVALSAAFFFLMYMVRRIPILAEDPVAVVILDFVLPIVIPIVGSYIFLWVAKRFVTQD
jgi:hypothetical protein